MTLVLGIDPGHGGAFAVYDTDTRRLVGDVIDCPTWLQVVGKRKRPRIDALAVADMFDVYVMMGVSLVVMEAVGGRPRQSAASGFVFGYTVGVTYMAAFYSGLVIETVPPQTWKQMMSVPGKARADDTAILARADELFPEDRAQFRGPSGGKKIDRAEAAIIAKFGGDIILPTFQGSPGVELRLAYRIADTGA
jgi:hypothetical protein